MATPTALQSSGLLNLEKELVCFICTEVLYQPLTLIDCLHTFCGSCLKEWFSHQYRKASHSHTPPSNPYTCPTCRATVKDVQHNAMINTLLEMFLAANPEKHRSAEERAEMAQIYKPGDNILPKVEPRRRERRRRDEEETARRERRAPADERGDRHRREGGSGAQSHDRLAPQAAERSRSRSRGHDDRRDRRIQERQQRREMRDRVEAAEAHLRDEAQYGETAAGQSLSPPPTSPRHPDAVEARSRARTVAHQASIRSLVSASDSGTGTGDSLNEAQLMQEILSEGLLDGINVDELTEAEQDELSEIIAERYRQLHPRGSRDVSGAEDRESTEAVISSALQETQLEEADRPRPASQGTARRTDRSPRSDINSAARPRDQRPSTSQSNTSQNEQNLSPPQNRAHRRRASDQGGREQVPRVHRGTHPGVSGNAAARSATDLSDRPRTEEAAAADGPQRLSNTGRSQTEPRQSLTASELWNRGGVTISRNRPSGTDSPTHPSPSIQHATLATTSSAISQSSARSPPQETSSDTTVEATSVTTSFQEPDISCYRCQRKGIQYEVYKHCSPCDLDLCIRCYRGGRGCNHWFGFGHAALARFDASHPRSRASQQIELPHLLVGRQYRKPPADSVKPKDADHHATTSSDPAPRLQEGHFCDACGNFANSCFWTCDFCNDGEWGFCNACVATHHCCTHPLLPIAHKDFAPGSPFQMQPVDPFANHLNATPGHSAPSSATSAADKSFGPQPDYVQLSITTHCDICTQPIPPPQTRYHCPSHPTPTPQSPKSIGDYDVCTSCYHNLVKIGRIRRDDGPAGWRKCPNGHRMVVTNFEADSDGGQRRVIVSDLVGGVKMTEENMREWNEAMAAASKDMGGLGAGGQMKLTRGRWTWYDPAEAEAATAANMADGSSNHRRIRQATIMPTSPSLSNATPTTATGTHKTSFSKTKFPPNGGFGRTCLGLWSYYPEEGADGKGELMFPKGADVCEVDEVNEEWSEGVYAGEIGFFPTIFARDVAT